MNPLRSNSRRCRKLEFGPEQLETRELLTGGSNTFAIIPGTVTSTNGTAQVQFTIDPAHFTLPRHALTLGIDVVPESGSTIKPFISQVVDPHSTLVPQVFHSIYDPHLSHLAVASGQGTSAVLAPLVLYPHQSNRPVTYTVDVQALGRTSGSFLLGFYLPGDANGDGVVNKADLAIVKSDLGVRAGSANYNFNADTNRDGRIGKIDVAYTLQNQGVSTNISPVVQANIDTSNDVGGLSQRVSKIPSAHFTGTATPGASVTYSEVNNQVPSTSTTADSSGNYSLTVPLANGVNTFKVTVKDAFGQVIQGTISPVSYVKPSATT
jgi:hypothetical protein